LAIAAAAFAAMAAVLAALWLRPAPEGRALRFEINPPRGTEFAFGGSLSAAVSPDGRMIAFVTVSDGATKLWTRPVDSIEARRLPGTDGAERPFWSPDSRSVGFFAEGKLKRIELSGGPPATIANAGAARGATWFPDGTVVFASQAISGFQRRLLRVRSPTATRSATRKMTLSDRL
jgi:eukaryotic-like serine/threonine-protein kinase